MSEQSKGRVTNDEKPADVQRPKVRIVFGPPGALNEIGLLPPMAIRHSDAWCQHVDAARQRSYEALRTSGKIHTY